MKAALLILLCGLAGCAGAGGGRPFQLTAEQVGDAWSALRAREEVQAEAEGLSPLWNPPPAFSAARCRWIEPGRKARCRYRMSQSFRRPGSPRVWTDQSAELYLTDRGWDFGY